jgi:hypothetical protein
MDHLKNIPFRRERDSAGVLRKRFQRICTQCGKEDWVSSQTLKNGRDRCVDCTRKDKPTEETRKKISNKLRENYKTPSYKELWYQKQLEVVKKGEDHWNWKGGITKDNASKREGTSQWRKSVYQRDLYHCRLCGSNNDLEAHHIIPFSINEKLQTEIENGITLCSKCHLTIHKYFREIGKHKIIEDTDVN